MEKKKFTIGKTLFHLLCSIVLIHIRVYMYIVWRILFSSASFDTFGSVYKGSVKKKIFERHGRIKSRRTGENGWEGAQTHGQNVGKDWVSFNLKLLHENLYRKQHLLAYTWAKLSFGQEEFCDTSLAYSIRILVWQLVDCSTVTLWTIGNCRWSRKIKRLCDIQK